MPLNKFGCFFRGRFMHGTGAHSGNAAFRRMSKITGLNRVQLRDMGFYVRPVEGK